MHITPELLKDLKENPFVILETMSIKEISSIIKTANQAYYSESEHLLPDSTYNIILEYLAKLVPNHPLLSESIIGALPSKNKIKLPIYMGSLTKVKDDDVALQRWQSKFKGNYIISDKLDGISCLLSVKNKSATLYSRGDGYIGQNISHLLKYIKLPDNLPEDLLIRGELILSKHDWDIRNNFINLQTFFFRII